MVLRNAGALLDVVPERPCVILHGHRHISSNAAADEVKHVIGAPSTTLGDDNPRVARACPGFAILTLGRTADDGVAVAATEQCPLAARRDASVGAGQAAT